MHWNAALKQANSSFIPGGAMLLVIAIGIELVTPVCIVIGWHDRLAAFVLAGFCAVTAVLYHPFWSYPDFWTPGDSKGRRNLWDFLKNFGLVGGLLLVVIVSGYAPGRTVIEQSFSSTPRAAQPLPVRAGPAAERPGEPASSLRTETTS